MNLDKIRGFIFDLDGTLIDTERLIEKVHSSIARDWGLPLKEGFFRETICTAPKQMEEILKANLGQDFDYGTFKIERDKRILIEIEEKGVPVMKGASETLDKISKSGYKIGIASSSSANTIRRYIKLAKWEELIDVIVGRDMVERTKPAPDCYQKACELLGLSPGECIAVEDSNPGIESAYLAGCRPVMVEDLSKPTEKTKKRSVAIYQSLGQIGALL